MPDLPPCPACDKMRILLTEAEIEQMRLQRDLAAALAELSVYRVRQPITLPASEYENQRGV